MELIDELRSEHDLIERVAGSLLTFLQCAARDPDPTRAEDVAAFLRFFRLYAGEFHHAREEDTLFAALERDAELPRDHGPLAVLAEDHRKLARLLDDLEAALRNEPGGAKARELAMAYVHSLWHHIDAESSVLFPEGEARLRRAGKPELSGRLPSATEDEARATGEDLVRRYAPSSDEGAFRGDACIACPAYGVSCQGLEREWWTEIEWEELPDHLPG